MCANLCIGFVVTGFRDKRDKDTFEYYLSLQSQNRRRCKMSGLNFWLFLSPPNNITLDSDGISMEFSRNVHVGTSLDLLLLVHLGQGPIAGLPLLQVGHLHPLFAGAIPVHLLVLEIGVVEEPESMYHSIIPSLSPPRSSRF